VHSSFLLRWTHGTVILLCRLDANDPRYEPATHEVMAETLQVTRGVGLVAGADVCCRRARLPGMWRPAAFDRDDHGRQRDRQDSAPPGPADQNAPTDAGQGPRVVAGCRAPRRLDDGVIRPGPGYARRLALPLAGPTNFPTSAENFRRKQLTGAMSAPYMGFIRGFEATSEVAGNV